MSDQDIRTLLRDLAEDVQDVRPLDHKALRRTRARRWAVAGTVVASVVVLAFGSVGLAFDAGPFGGGRAVAPVAPPGETPSPPRPMPGTIVGYGTTEDGNEWWLSAYESDTGELCVDLQHDTGDMTEDCSPYDPEDVGLANDPDDGPGPRNVFGWVPGDTGKLWVTRAAELYVDGGPEDDTSEEEDDPDGIASGSDGDPDDVTTRSDEADGQGVPGPDVEIRGDEEVQLFDAPEGFPFPVRFYAVVPGVDDAHALLVVMSDGDETVLIMSQPDLPERHPFELVAAGIHEGYEWELLARTIGEERCIRLHWADEEFGSGEGCSTAVPRAESAQYTMVRFGGDKSSTVAFYAAVSKDVSSLDLNLDDGTVMELEILGGSEAGDVDYAVGWLPLDENGSTGGFATARDAEGNALGTMELCELAGPLTSCASDSPPP
jgi:hypothetical protein